MMRLFVAIATMTTTAAAATTTTTTTTTFPPAFAHPLLSLSSSSSMAFCSSQSFPTDAKTTTTTTTKEAQSQRLASPPFSLLCRASRYSTSTTATAATNANTVEGRKINDGGMLQPVNNFVLVRVADVQEKTDSGILLSKSAKIVKTEGIVVSVGPGRYHPDSGIVCPVPVDPGDGVVYGKYDGTLLDYNGSKHALIRDSDILVKFTVGGDGGGTETVTEDNVDVCDDNVLVLPDDVEEETEGGLLLAVPSKNSPNSSRPSTGTVVKVGPGRMLADATRTPMTVSVGDRVKFRDFAGNEVNIQGKEFSVVKMTEVLAKF